MLKFYGYKKCGTCRKAEKKLAELGQAYEFIDITASPPTANDLQKVAQQAHVAPEKLFNTSGVQYRELNIKTKLPGMSPGEIFALLAGNGRLIKRPIVTNGENSTVGYQETVFAQAWG